MLYVFVGGATARDKARAFVDGLRAKKPEATFVRLSGDLWDPNELRGLATAESLFAGASIVRMDGFFATRESADLVSPILPALADSKNIFVFVEDKLLVDDKRLLEPLTKEFKELQATSYKPQARPFNIYSLSDALATKERRPLWLLYQEALRAGVSPEEIFWKFVWQVRVLLAAREGKEGMKAIGSSVDPARALGKGRAWSREALLGLSQTLVLLYHDFERFRGEPDLEFALERIILTI